MAYTKSFWNAHPFPPINVGEDAKFVWADSRAKIQVLKNPHFLVAVIHDGNCSPKRTSDPRYRPRPVQEIERLLAHDLSFYAHLKDQGGETAAAPAVPGQKARALISAALGVGDILRVTPLIRVAHRLGYETDVLLATDYADVVELLEGAPEIRQVFHVPSPRRGTTPDRIDGLIDQSYEFATFTTWSAALRDRVQARRVHLFERDRRLTEGDSRCIERVVHDLGWGGIFRLHSPWLRAEGLISRPEQSRFTRGANTSGPGRNGTASRNSQGCF